MDHSYVQTLVDRGELTEEEANVHPQSNILMGCLGAEEDPPADGRAGRSVGVGEAGDVGRGADVGSFGGTWVVDHHTQGTEPAAGRIIGWILVLPPW